MMHDDQQLALQRLSSSSTHLSITVHFLPDASQISAIGTEFFAYDIAQRGDPNEKVLPG
jgi:hypothetical protein